MALEDKHGWHPLLLIPDAQPLPKQRGRSPAEADNSLAEKGVPSRVGITFIFASPTYM